MNIFSPLASHNMQHYKNCKLAANKNKNQVQYKEKATTSVRSLDSKQCHKKHISSIKLY